MKKLILTTVVMLILSSGSILKSQSYPEEYLGMPGDNLNLYAVMDLFRESATLEGFERSLNDPDQMINNLDLNRDNFVDYIMVKDYVNGNVHTIVLRVAMSARDFQDVAVFTVERLNDGSVRIQLIGDESLYGKNYIIEPIYDETPNPGYKGNSARSGSVKVVTTTYHHVAAWPVVRYIYMPSYVVWYSPYYYGYYPVYWARWSPHYWHFYYGYHYNWHSHYYSYYRPWSYYRYSGYNSYYYNGFRHRSPQVVVWVREGNYRSTYSRPDELSRGKNHYHTVAATQGRGANTTSTSSRSTVTPRTTGATNSNARVANTTSSSKRSSTSANARSEASPRTQSSTTAVRTNSNANTRATGQTPTVRTTESPRQPAGTPAVRSNTSARTTNQSTTVRSSGTTRPQSSAPAVSTGRSTGKTSAMPAATKISPSSSRSSVVSTPANSNRGSSVGKPSSSNRGSSVSAPAARSSSNTGATRNTSPARAR